MPAFNLASFVVDVRKVYENKRGGDTLKPVHSWWHNYQMQLQVSFGMVGVYGCLWVFMGAEMHREFIEPAADDAVIKCHRKLSRWTE